MQRVQATPCHEGSAGQLQLGQHRLPQIPAADRVPAGHACQVTLHHTNQAIVLNTSLVLIEIAALTD